VRKIYDLLNALFLALTTYSVLSVYPALPDRIPVHFGMSGTPDRWGSKSELFILVALSWGLTVIFYALAMSMPRFARNPRYLNIPHKREFLKLPAERQAIYWELIREFMIAIIVSCNFLFFLIARGTLRVVQKQAAGLPFKAAAAGLVAMALVMIVYFPRMLTLPGKLIRGDEF
jgi:uncharacterized membrane protein